MGRRKKDDSGSSSSSEPAKTNGYDRDAVESYVARLEVCHDDIATIMAEAMNKCRAIHTDMKDIYQEAKDNHGVPKKALKTVIKVRQLEAKADKLREDLEPEMQDSYDNIRLALGDFADTPLGEAAASRAPDSPQAFSAPA